MDLITTPQKVTSQDKYNQNSPPCSDSSHQNNDKQYTPKEKNKIIKKEQQNKQESKIQQQSNDKEPNAKKSSVFKILVKKLIKTLKNPEKISPSKLKGVSLYESQSINEKQALEILKQKSSKWEKRKSLIINPNQQQQFQQINQQQNNTINENQISDEKIVIIDQEIDKKSLQKLEQIVGEEVGYGFQEMKNLVLNWNSLLPQEQLKTCLSALMQQPENRHYNQLQTIENYMQDFQYIKRYTRYEKNFPRKIAQLVSYEYCPKGKNVFLAGDEAEYFYIVLKGSVGVVLMDTNTNNNQQINNDEEKDQQLNENSTWIVNEKYKRYGDMRVDNLMPIISEERVFDNTNLLQWKDLQNPKLFLEKNIQLVKILDKGIQFGEIGIFHKAKRSATILALEDTHLVKMNKIKYEQAIKLIEKQRFSKRLRFFQNTLKVQISNQDFSQVILNFDNKVKYANNQLIFKEGDKVDRIYIIKKGEVQISQKQSLQKDQIQNIKQNDYLRYLKGSNQQQQQNNLQQVVEYAISTRGIYEFIGLSDYFLKKKQRSYSAKSVSSSTKCFSISISMFARLMIKQPYLNKILSTRINNNSQMGEIVKKKVANTLDIQLQKRVSQELLQKECNNEFQFDKRASRTNKTKKNNSVLLEHKQFKKDSLYYNQQKLQQQQTNLSPKSDRSLENNNNNNKNQNQQQQQQKSLFSQNSVKQLQEVNMNQTINQFGKVLNKKREQELDNFRKNKNRQITMNHSNNNRTITKQSENFKRNAQHKQRQKSILFTFQEEIFKQSDKYIKSSGQKSHDKLKQSIILTNRNFSNSNNNNIQQQFNQQLQQQHQNNNDNIHILKENNNSNNNNQQQTINQSHSYSNLKSGIFSSNSQQSIQSGSTTNNNSFILNIKRRLSKKQETPQQQQQQQQEKQQQQQQYQPPNSFHKYTNNNTNTKGYRKLSNSVQLQKSQKQKLVVYQENQQQQQLSSIFQQKYQQQFEENYQNALLPKIYQNNNSDTKKTKKNNYSNNKENQNIFYYQQHQQQQLLHQNDYIKTQQY